MSDTEQKTGGQGPSLEFAEFEKFLEKEFKPKTQRAKSEVQQAVQTLAEQALKSSLGLSNNVVHSINQMIAELDKRLADQVNEIIHNEKFQRLEGSWRGLKFLLDRTETGKDLKIRALNVSKAEIKRELEKFPGKMWDQSPLFRKLYEEEYGVLGGVPYGALVGDYYFSHEGYDVDILSGMAQIAAASHAPFIAGADPKMFDLEDWRDIVPIRDLATIADRPDRAEWKALRKKEDARYVGLAMPRFLARRPYGKNNPVDQFQFEEETGGADPSKFCWSNAAFAMASNITRAFKLYGWASRIRGVESGGTISDLPTHTFPSEDGEWASQCPTEVSITDRRELELANLGLMPLQFRKNSNEATFIGAQSIQEPASFQDKDATANARLGARLPYIFAVSRFAHYLKIMARDKIGSYKEKSDVERWLGDWIQNYVLTQQNVSEQMKAEKPLSFARVTVEEDQENPGAYRAKFELRPHYQLEAITMNLSLVSRLKQA